MVRTGLNLLSTMKMTDLSPAAQAVLDAGMGHSGPAFEPVVRRMTAAALRAAALIPNIDRLRLLAIADELEDA